MSFFPLDKNRFLYQYNVSIASGRKGHERPSQTLSVAGWARYSDPHLRLLPSLSLVENHKGTAHDPGHVGFADLLPPCPVDRSPSLRMGASKSVGRHPPGPGRHLSPGAPGGAGP